MACNDPVPNAAPRLSGWRGTLGLVLLVIAVNLALIDNDVALAGTSLAWSAVGFTTALLTLAPTSRWILLVPLTLIIPVGAAVAQGVDAELAVRFGAVEAVAALVAALLLRRGRREVPSLATPRDVLWLFIAAGAAGAIGIAQPALEATELNPPDWKVLAAALMAHATSVVAVLALGLTLRYAPPRGTTTELVTQVGAIGAVTYLVFGMTEGLPLPFLLVPIIGWAALRLDRRVVALELGALSAIVGAVSFRGDGPFVSLLPRDSEPIVVSLVANAFVLSLYLVALPLVTAVYQASVESGRTRDNEEVMHQLFLDSPVGILLLHAEGATLVVDEINEAARDSLGMAPAGVGGWDLLDLIEPIEDRTTPHSWVRDDVGPIWRGLARARLRHESWLDVHVATMNTDRGLIYSVQLIDLTDERVAMARVESVQQLTDATVDTARCIIMVVDSRGRVLRLNAATREITGYSEVDLLGVPVWDSPLNPIDHTDFDSLLMWPNRSGQPVYAERPMLGKGGERLRVMWSCNVVSAPGNPSEYAVVTGVDVTSERASAGLLTHLMQAGIGTALIGIDNRGMVMVFNHGAALLLGFDAEEMLGKPFVEILDPRQLQNRTAASTPGEQFMSLVGSINLEQEAPPRDWTWITKDGAPIEVSMSLSLTDDIVSDRVGFLCVGQDVTKPRETQRALAEALETERGAIRQLRELDRAKDEFVSTVSHELRTPTTSIVGYTELLLGNAEDEEDTAQLRLLRAIERNGKRLVVICDDLLLLSGFQSDTTRRDSRRIDLGEVLRAAEESVPPLLAKRQLDVVFAGADSHIEVVGDIAQLERAIINLVSNAIKFTEDGGRIEVDLEVVGNQARITVADTGIGIAAADRDKVFQRFYRTATAQERAIQGTGLGLAIVSSIVESHQGRIDLTSKVGEGTKIVVRLPLPPNLSLVSTVEETG